MMLVDFTKAEEIWTSINDDVMGGVSESVMTPEDGFAAFRGRVSFENNGGFASVRSAPTVYDLGTFEGLLIRVRGDGKRYGLRLRSPETRPSYQAILEPPTDQWCEIRLPFDSFRSVYRGRDVPDAPALDLSNVRTMGLIITRQEGPFKLDIAWIAGYSASS